VRDAPPAPRTRKDILSFGDRDGLDLSFSEVSFSGRTKPLWSRRMMGVILVLVYFGMAALAALILLQPDRFSVTRARVISAPAQQIFGYIDDLHNWRAWSPWTRRDPGADIRYAGPAAGEGASLEWSGDEKLGAGRMAIIESRPFESVRLKLDMRKPFAASRDMFFLLTPEEDGRTKVVWTLTGRNTLLSKATGLFPRRDRIVGGQLERGLVHLEEICGK
jgi:hypothetical protein